MIEYIKLYEFTYNEITNISRNMKTKQDYEFYKEKLERFKSLHHLLSSLIEETLNKTLEKTEKNLKLFNRC